MKPQTAMIFRLVGLLIELVCVSFWMRLNGQGRKIYGQPVEPILVAGILLGFTLWAISVAFKRQPRKPYRPPEF